MVFPLVNGWIIDYRTAHIVFSSSQVARTTHLIGICQTGLLYISHHEESKFRADGLLVQHFLDDQCCVYEPDDDIYDRCPGIKNSATNKPFLVGSGDATTFIAAVAVAKNLGVISDHSSNAFTTVRDLCPIYGVPILTSEEYFALALNVATPQLA